MGWTGAWTPRSQVLQAHLIVYVFRTILRKHIALQRRIKSSPSALIRRASKVVRMRASVTVIESGGPS